jgi:hypothetical protein
MEVTEPHVLQALSNPALLTALAAFLGRERSVTQAARAAGLNVKRMHALTCKLLDVGLLRVTRETPRAGRAIKSYTAAATSLFLPFDATTFETFEHALNRADAPFRRTYFASIAHLALSSGTRWGLCVSSSGGELRVSAGAAPAEDVDVFSPSFPAVLPLTWSLDVRLDFEDAKSLQRDLEALRAKYAGRNGAQTYALRLALAPVVRSP